MRGVCEILLELNSLSVIVFDLRHDGVGVKGLGFLLHTIFREQICRCKTCLGMSGFGATDFVLYIYRTVSEN